MSSPSSTLFTSLCVIFPLSSSSPSSSTPPPFSFIQLLFLPSRPLPFPPAPCLPPYVTHYLSCSSLSSASSFSFKQLFFIPSLPLTPLLSPYFSYHLIHYSSYSSLYPHRTLHHYSQSFKFSQCQILSHWFLASHVLKVIGSHWLLRNSTCIYLENL